MWAQYSWHYLFVSLLHECSIKFIFLLIFTLYSTIKSFVRITNHRSNLTFVHSDTTSANNSDILFSQGNHAYRCIVGEARVTGAEPLPFSIKFSFDINVFRKGNKWKLPFVQNDNKHKYIWNSISSARPFPRNVLDFYLSISFHLTLACLEKRSDPISYAFKFAPEIFQRKLDS